MDFKRHSIDPSDDEFLHMEGFEVIVLDVEDNF